MSTRSVHSTSPTFSSLPEHDDSTTTNSRCFCCGFLMRPIGGWLFGCIADKHGRKKSMLLSVCMMCFGSLVIASQVMKL
ncbi:MFS transporter [Escherichia coli]